MLEAVFNAVLHGPPELHQAGADFFLAAPDEFVGHHQFGNPQVVTLAEFEQLHGAGKIVRQFGAVQIHHTAAGLRLIDDKTATDGIIGVAMQLAVIPFGDQGHGVGMEWQVFIDQAHVPRPDEWHG
ncbi:hypothetical protein D3C73_1228980 [compost metagenome]